MHEYTGLYPDPQIDILKFRKNIINYFFGWEAIKKKKQDEGVESNLLNFIMIKSMKEFILHNIPDLIHKEDKSMDINDARPYDLEEFIATMRSLLINIPNIDPSEPLYSEYKEILKSIKTLMKNIIFNGLVDYEENAKLFLYAILTSEEYEDKDYLRSLFFDKEIETLKKRLSEKFTSESIPPDEIIDIVWDKYLPLFTTKLHMSPFTSLDKEEIIANIIDSDPSDSMFFIQDLNLENKLTLFYNYILYEVFKNFNVNEIPDGSYQMGLKPLIFQHKINLYKQKISSPTSHDTSHILEKPIQAIDLINIRALFKEILNKTIGSIYDTNADKFYDTDADKFYAKNKDNIHEIIDLMIRSQDDSDNKNYLTACEKIINLITKTMEKNTNYYSLKNLNSSRIELINDKLFDIKQGILSNKAAFEIFKITNYEEKCLQLKTILQENITKEFSRENDHQNIIDIIDSEWKEKYYKYKISETLTRIINSLCNIRDGAHAFVKIAEDFYQDKYQSNSVTQENTSITGTSEVPSTLKVKPISNRKRPSSHLLSSDNIKKIKDRDSVISGTLFEDLSLEEEDTCQQRESDLSEPPLNTSHDLSNQSTIINTSQLPLDTLPTIYESEENESELIIEETAMQIS